MTTLVYHDIMTPQLEGYMTTLEAADYLEITAAGVRQHIRRHNLPGAIKVGRDWLIPVEDLDAIKGKGPGRPPGEPTPGEQEGVD